MTGFPAVAGDIVFFVTALTKPNRLRAARRALYTTTFTGGQATCRSRQRGQRRILTLTGARVTAPSSSISTSRSGSDRRSRSSAIRTTSTTVLARSASGFCPGGTCGSTVASVVCPFCSAETKGPAWCRGAARSCGPRPPPDKAAGLRHLWPLSRSAGARGRCLVAGLLISAVSSRPESGSSISRRRRSVPAARPAAACQSSPARPDPGFLDPKTWRDSRLYERRICVGARALQEGRGEKPNDGDALNNLGPVVLRMGDPGRGHSVTSSARWRLFPTHVGISVQPRASRGQPATGGSVDDYRRRQPDCG